MSNAYEYYSRRNYGASRADLEVVNVDEPEPGSAWDAVHKLTRAEAVERFGLSLVEYDERRADLRRAA